LNEGKPLLERGELLKELFLSEFLFRRSAFVFVVSVDETFQDDAPSCWVGLGGSRAYLRQGASIDTRSL
jgi:hypothetical protein